MIDTEQLERLAASDAEMPNELELPEQLLFLTLRTLYQNFHSGEVNRDRAKREKSRIYVAYQKLQNEYKLTKHHLQIRERLSKNIGELYSCGCPHCKHLLNVFNGVDRQDIPQDAKELHAQNNRLRDMVQERSERNAELATTIDRVRWALDGENPIEKIKDIVRKEN